MYLRGVGLTLAATLVLAGALAAQAVAQPRDRDRDRDFDRRGRMVAQAVTGTPGHINSMATGMRHFLAAFPPETLRPGDVLVTNDPWKTASQLNDITVATPVFRDDRLVAFFANTCHAGVGANLDKKPVARAPDIAFLARLGGRDSVGRRISDVHKKCLDGRNFQCWRLLQGGDSMASDFTRLRHALECCLSADRNFNSVGHDPTL